MSAFTPQRRPGFTDGRRCGRRLRNLAESRRGMSSDDRTGGTMENRSETKAHVAVIYYSATGNVHGLARALAEGAEQAGAEVRLRHVEELASELQISQNQYWGRHRSQVAEAAVATIDDLDWADGIAFGTPTRFGN